MIIRIRSAEDYNHTTHLENGEYITTSTGKKVLVPCMNTLLVAPSLILANTYNPNSVSHDKMELLRQSILDNGFCFPIVTIWDYEIEMFVIVDGFHRTLIGSKKWLDFDFIPIVVLDKTMAERMTATVQFNKARGVHQVDLDADIIRALLQQGMTEDEISNHLKIDSDTIFRYKQVTGIASLFANVDYSMSWEMRNTDEIHGKNGSLG